MQPLPFQPRSNISAIVIVFVLIILPILYHLFATFIHTLSGLFMFILWIFMFHQTWAPSLPSSTADGDDETQTHHLNNIKHFYCANICSIIFKGPLDRYYE